MIKSLIKKYILPKEIDFISALQEHAMIIKYIVDDLQKCFIDANDESCQAILHDQHKAQKIRDKNMKNLLNVFITPIDRESIYRVITELDWIAISIRHFLIEAKSYQLDEKHEAYDALIKKIQLQSELLTAGFKTLKKNRKKTAQSAKRVRDTYDELMDVYIKEVSTLVKSKKLENIFIHKELLSQLKEISKRMRITANSLEDIIMKMT